MNTNPETETPEAAPRAPARLGMTTDQIAALTDDELRVKVAEVLIPSSDWKCCRCERRAATIIRASAFFCDEQCAERVGDYALDDGHRQFERECNFPASLDACAQFERTMSDADRGTYAKTLYLTMENTSGQILESHSRRWGDMDWRMDWSEGFLLATASPLQRCIAFLVIQKP